MYLKIILLISIVKFRQLILRMLNTCIIFKFRGRKIGTVLQKKKALSSFYKFYKRKQNALDEIYLYHVKNFCLHFGILQFEKFYLQATQNLTFLKPLLSSHCSLNTVQCYTNKNCSFSTFLLPIK